jgi:enoyl-CoA hydratase/carnithine racemase
MTVYRNLFLTVIIIANSLDAFDSLHYEQGTHHFKLKRSSIMPNEEILYATQGPIGILTLNNPKKINALSRKMIAEIMEVLTAVSEDESINVLIIRAAGKHFCAGHYMKEMVDQGIKECKNIFDQCTRMMQMIHEIPQPVIAQVQGIATAAGCQLVAWCDLAVAAEDARFATPGVKIGLFCTTPMVAITRAIGRKAAMEMLLTGRYFSAQEAKQLGLVNRVVSLENLNDETETLANQIAEASRFVLSIGKQGFYAQVDQSDSNAMHYAKHTIAMNLKAIDAQNGIKAFLNKEDCVWQNC